MNHLHSTEHNGHAQPQTAQGAHQEILRTVLDMPIPKDSIVTRAPAEPFRLNFVDVTCLVINRTIGTYHLQASHEMKCTGLRLVEQGPEFSALPRK